MLVAEKLQLQYGQTVALAEASAAIGAGETVALVGPSGSGKSSLLYCLAGLIRPSEGRVLFEGRDLAALSDDDRSDVRRISFGFVFQFAELVPELTLRENIALPLEMNRVGRKKRAQRVSSLLERLDLTAHADRRPSKVSGGQAQRAAVARAVAHGPRVVFADEPTGALDSINGKLVLDTLMDLSRQDGAAVVLVTHDLDIARSTSRMISLRDGYVSAVGG